MNSHHRRIESLRLFTSLTKKKRSRLATQGIFCSDNENGELRCIFCGTTFCYQDAKKEECQHKCVSKKETIKEKSQRQSDENCHEIHHRKCIDIRDKHRTNSGVLDIYDNYKNQTENEEKRFIPVENIQDIKPEDPLQKTEREKCCDLKQSTGDSICDDKEKVESEEDIPQENKPQVLKTSLRKTEGEKCKTTAFLSDLKESTGDSVSDEEEKIKTEENIPQENKPQEIPLVKIQVEKQKKDQFCSDQIKGTGHGVCDEEKKKKTLENLVQRNETLVLETSLRKTEGEKCKISAFCSDLKQSTGDIISDEEEKIKSEENIPQENKPQETPLVKIQVVKHETDQFCSEQKKRTGRSVCDGEKKKRTLESLQKNEPRVSETLRKTEGEKCKATAFCSDLKQNTGDNVCDEEENKKNEENILQGNRPKEIPLVKTRMKKHDTYQFRNDQIKETGGCVFDEDNKKKPVENLVERNEPLEAPLQKTEREKCSDLTQSTGDSICDEEEKIKSEKDIPQENKPQVLKTSLRKTEGEKCKTTAFLSDLKQSTGDSISDEEEKIKNIPQENKPQETPLVKIQVVKHDTNQFCSEQRKGRGFSVCNEENKKRTLDSLVQKNEPRETLRKTEGEKCKATAFCSDLTQSTGDNICNEEEKMKSEENIPQENKPREIPLVKTRMKKHDTDQFRNDQIKGTGGCVFDEDNKKNTVENLVERNEPLECVGAISENRTIDKKTGMKRNSFVNADRVSVMKTPMIALVFFILISMTMSQLIKCPESLQTMEKVGKCPASTQEWEKAENRKKCWTIRQPCMPNEEFQYQCLPNSNNELVEFCAKSYKSPNGYCLCFDLKKQRISYTNDKCFDFGCPTNLTSSEIYKYEECYANYIGSYQTTTMNPSFVMTPTPSSKSFRSKSSIWIFWVNIFIVLFLQYG